MIRDSLKWAVGLIAGCIGCMILFNMLPSEDPQTKETYREYASYAFDTLKVLFGIVIGALTEKFHGRAVAQALKKAAEEKKPTPPAA